MYLKMVAKGQYKQQKIFHFKIQNQDLHSVSSVPSVFHLILISSWLNLNKNTFIR